MEINFCKYHGAGNDFILIDNRSSKITLNTEQIAHLCHRHFGIGADGLMLLEHEDGYDFKMLYYNADGNESTMCGNGGRCIVAFALQLKIITQKAHFLAIDGAHFAEILQGGIVRLQMTDVPKIEFHEDFIVLNTGSPHYIKWVADNKDFDVFTMGKAIRNQSAYLPNGINVNFVQCTEAGLFVRTYERGVENETLSCGTGVTAAAIASSLDKIGVFSVDTLTLGGKLKIDFEKDTPTTAKNIFLTGPAKKVFEGLFSL